MRYVERQTFRQEPYCYDGDSCDKHRPRWMTSYPKEGDEEDGEVLRLEIPATSMPPGSRVTIEVPVERLRYWDEDKKQYLVEPGDYEFLVAAASDDIRLKLPLAVATQ